MRQTKIGKEVFQAMSNINYFKYLFLFLLTSHGSVVSQVTDKLLINLEKVDLKSANDSMIKYKQVNPQKSLKFGFYALKFGNIAINRKVGSYAIKDMINEKIGLDKLIITKSLNGYSASPVIA